METEDILGYSVTKGTACDCADAIANLINRNNAGCRWLACFNPHSYAIARGCYRFADALINAHFLVPDGAGILLASRVMRGKIRERVTGSDVFREVNSRLNEVGGSVFLLGTTNQTLAAVSERMAIDFPNVKIVGMYSPPFTSEFSAEDTDSMVRAVNLAEPDVLWVSMTSPKQDIWLHRNASLLKTKFAAGVGAVFDFYSGRVKRSHPLFQRFGLEWLPRLLQEPRRLWRRMVISAPIFLWDVMRARLGFFSRRK